MLEDFALNYSQLPEDQARLLNYAFAILGGIIGGLTDRSVAEIRRAPYFALSSAIFLCVSVANSTGMAFVVQALANGFFWVVASFELIASCIGGFLLARIALARSRDAYGHGRRAALAFIPIANLWLLLTPSRVSISANRAPTIPLLTGILGVLTGFVLFGIGISLSTYAQIDGLRRVEAAAADGVFTDVMLERILRGMAADVKIPITVDEVTTLLRLETKESELRYVYEIDPPANFLPVSMRIGLLQQNCSNDELANVIDAGAAITHVYLRKDGSEIGAIEVTRQACGR